MTDETDREVAQLKKDVAKYNHWGFEGVFLTSQWDRLVELIGDEEATKWYKSLGGSEDYA